MKRVATPYYIGLSDDGLRELGKVAAQWAVLEYLVGSLTLALSGRYKTPAPGNQKKDRSFTERRDALKKAFSQPQVPEVLKVRAAAAFEGLWPVEQNRHGVMHAMALTLADERVLFTKGWPEKDAFQRAFSLEQLSDVALDLGRINGELEQLLLDVYHPGRWNSAATSKLLKIAGPAV